MKPSNASTLVPAAALLLLLGCAGCLTPRPDRTRWFALNGPAPATPAVSVAASVPVRIGVRPAVLPSYVESKRMALRSGSCEIRYDDFARWSQPLEDAVAQRLCAALAAADGAVSARNAPWGDSFAPQQLLQVRFTHFEGGTDGALAVAGSWELLDAGTGRGIASGSYRSDPALRWTPGRPESLVEGLGACVDAIARQVQPALKPAPVAVPAASAK